MKKFSFIFSLVTAPTIFTTACSSNIAQFPQFSFNSSKVKFNGIDINKKKFYSTISPSEISIKNSKFVDSKDGSIFESYINNNFFSENALKNGYVGFQKNVYSSLEESLESVVRQEHGLFYDGILFPNSNALNNYAKTKKELFLKNSTVSDSTILELNNVKSEPINVDSLRQGSIIEKQKILNFIVKNANLQLEINGKNNTSKETVNFSTSNESNYDSIASKIISNIDDKYIPVNYQKISSNNNSGQFFVDLSNEDKYELYGPLIHKGSADIQGILHPENWKQTSEIPIALFRDHQSLLVSHAFDFLISETEIENDDAAKKLNSSLEKQDFVFYFSYGENELKQTNKSVNLQLNLAWAEFISLLKKEQKQIYTSFIEMVKSLNKAQRYTSFHKSYLTYSFLLDSIINNNGSENLIFLLKNFYNKLSDKIDSTLEFLNSLTLPLGFNMLLNRDINGENFSFKKYFGFGNKDFDLGANLDHLLPNIQYQYRNLNILFSIFYLSDALIAMPSSFIDKNAIISTIQGLKIDSNDNVKNYYKPILDKYWKVIEPLWWLINSQNLTQSLYVLGFDSKNLVVENLDIDKLVLINRLNQIFGIKWARNQVVLSLVSEKIKEEIELIIGHKKTSNKKVNSDVENKIKELFKYIPVDILKRLKNINIDLQTLDILKNLFEEINKIHEYNRNLRYRKLYNRFNTEKFKDYKPVQVRIEKFLESLYSPDYVDVYLRMAARFDSNKVLVKDDKITERSINFNISLEKSTDSQSGAGAFSDSSTTTSMAKTGDVNAVLKNSTSQINLKELKALEVNHVGEENRQKINDAIDNKQSVKLKLPNLNISFLIIDQFTNIFSNSLALSSAINNPDLINRTREIIFSSVHTFLNLNSFIGNILTEMSNSISKISSTIASLGPVFSIVSAAASIALFLLDVFYPKEEKLYYVFKSGSSEYVWTGGYKKTWLLGTKVLESRTIKDIKLIGPIQITRPQNEDFLYYNQKKYSSSQVNELKKMQIKEWIENKNPYALVNPDYLKGVKKIYSLHNETNLKNFNSIYSSSSFYDIYQNIENALINDKVLGIDTHKTQIINGQLAQDNSFKDAIYESEVKNNTQNWTIFEVPNTAINNGLVFDKNRSIKIQNLVEFDIEAGIGIAKGFGRFGNEGEIATFVITNKSISDESVKSAIFKKFSELYKPIETKYFDMVGSRSKLIYETSLYEIYDKKISKNVYFASISDAKKYIEKSL